MVLSENSDYQIYDPRVAVTPNGLAHVVCWKRNAPNAIYYATFRPDKNDYIGWASLATGSNDSQRKLPNVVTDHLGRVHVAWYDAIDHPDSVGKREVYYTRLIYVGGQVVSGAGGTIDRKRLTTTTNGYSPSYSDAPEMAADSGGSIHMTWTDQESAKSSTGIRYLKIGSNGSVAVPSKVVFNTSITSGGPREGHFPVIAWLPGGGARIVARVAPGLSSGYRLWQVDVTSTGVPGTPFMLTDAGGRPTTQGEDTYPSIGADSGGTTHLVYAADTGVSVGGSRNSASPTKTSSGSRSPTTGPAVTSRSTRLTPRTPRRPLLLGRTPLSRCMPRCATRDGPRCRVVPPRSSSRACRWTLRRSPRSWSRRPPPSRSTGRFPTTRLARRRHSWSVSRRLPV